MTHGPPVVSSAGAMRHKHDCTYIAGANSVRDLGFSYTGNGNFVAGARNKMSTTPVLDGATSAT